MDGDCDPNTNAAGESYIPIFYDNGICEESASFVMNHEAFVQADCNFEDFSLTLAYYHLDPGCSLVNQEWEITFNNGECVEFSTLDRSETWRYHFIYENFCVRVEGCNNLLFG